MARDYAEQKSKAQKAANAQRGTTSTKSVKMRTKPHFYRPYTKRTPKAPTYTRKSAPLTKVPKMDKYRIIRSPLSTEAAMKKIEDHNTLVFLVDVLANKRQIRAAVKELYEIQAEKVNTLIRPDGKKKAYVKLTQEQDALEIANRIGII
ncbi:60S ribosomal protein L23a [Hondaea fermentalgiana]|uniref:60S ribosomal protein L23a n=1 Tax=Hondaea fermentalgiana TaxID=2315210 RepID=A0A2R5GTE2_9STRA|nr:60S ribosomal protein L23a [Hondaea fermentalgiana]|eukprot:GBG34136.1 60S ribosomal protein L23a [Hondaea fermentalgiana]